MHELQDNFGQWTKRVFDCWVGHVPCLWLGVCFCSHQGYPMVLLPAPHAFLLRPITSLCPCSPRRLTSHCDIESICMTSSEGLVIGSCAAPFLLPPFLLPSSPRPPVPSHAHAYPQVLVFAIAYGFQQIQNVTRQIGGKTKAKCPYHFVEVMACPSGCLNGGGQIKATAQRTTETNKDLLKRVHSIYQEYLASSRAMDVQRHPLLSLSAPQVPGDQPACDTTPTPTPITPLSAPTVDDVYQKFIGAEVYSDQARKLLHTQYHAVAQTLTTQGVASPAVNNW